MSLWLRRQIGCIFYVFSNAAEYRLPTYLRFILRSLGLSLNTVVLCGIMPSSSNYQIASSEPQKRTLRIIFLALHYQQALATNGCVPLHTRRMELFSKLFTKIKEPESRLRHLVPPTRSQAHGRSLHYKDSHPLQVANLNALNEAFFRRCAFMLMACKLRTYANLMYNLILYF